MKVSVFDTHEFEHSTLCEANQSYRFDLIFHETRLTEKTLPLAKGSDCVCVFVNDSLNAPILKGLSDSGVKLIALRSAGFNHVDLEAARVLNIPVVRVPEYSPYAVAEHAVAMMLCLNRKLHKSYNRVREGNFSLEGLVGFDVHGKTVGVVGTGKIGRAFIHIMRGFGVHVLAHDIVHDEKAAEEMGFKYVPLDELLGASDIISLHLPLKEDNVHLIDSKTFSKMKRGVILINTSRGRLIDTKALIEALKESHLGAAALDVYEEEENLFFQDHSTEILKDDILARLMTFPNVLLTSHQAFLTREALQNIAETTLWNISQFAGGQPLMNQVELKK